MNTEFTTFGQFKAWFRVAKRGSEQAVPRTSGTVKIATPDDLPAPPEHSLLPLVLTLIDGTTMRRLQQPRALDWGPKSNYAEILLFKVTSK